MHHPSPVEHARHDLELVAGHAAGDLSDAERARGDELLRTCTACADLRRDLVAISAATRTVPAFAAPRDYRLTHHQAARLRRGGWIASLLRPFAPPRSNVRPMAMAFTSLGLAGLLVANILPALFGSAGATGGAASAPEAAGAPPAASAGSAPEAAGRQLASAAPGVYPVSNGPQASGTRGGVEFGPQSQPTAALDQSGGSKSNQASAAPGYAADGGAGQSGAPSAEQFAAAERQVLAEAHTNPVFIGSLVLLVIGLALFGLGFLARRVR